MYLKDEQKKIVDEFNELMPWDKEELIVNIIENNLNGDQLKKVCKDLGFVNYDEIDFVKEVIDNGLKEEVLDEMSDYEICDYLFNSSFDGNSSENLKDWLERMDNSEIADALSGLDDKDLNQIVHFMRSDKIVNILNYLIKSYIK